MGCGSHHSAASWFRFASLFASVIEEKLWRDGPFSKVDCAAASVTCELTTVADTYTEITDCCNPITLHG